LVGTGVQVEDAVSVFVFGPLVDPVRAVLVFDVRVAVFVFEALNGREVGVDREVEPEVLRFGVVVFLVGGKLDVNGQLEVTF
jgi:hypothetical protein